LRGAGAGPIHARMGGAVRGLLVAALVQHRADPDPGRNLARAVAAVGRAADRGGRLVVLQELFRSRYFCQSEDTACFDLAEPIPGPSTEALGKVAAERGVYVVAPIFERRAPGVYHNSAVLLGPDGAVAGHYRKMHIPDDPLYFEKFYFTPGDRGFRSFPLAGLEGPGAEPPRLGMLICWDQWFPEAARATALAGADVLVYPTAIGWQHDEGPEIEAAQHDAWETVQRAHAIANGVFVLAVNRVGREGGIRFFGQSFAADPYGRVLARAPADEEALLLVELDLDLVERARREWPFLRDRRVDAYGGLTRLFAGPGSADGEAR